MKQHGGLGYTKIRGSTHLQIEDGESSVIIPILSASQIQAIHKKNAKRVRKLQGKILKLRINHEFQFSKNKFWICKDHCKAYSGRTEVRKLYENEYFIDKDLKMSGCIPAETREYNIQYFYDRTSDLATSR